MPVLTVGSGTAGQTCSSPIKFDGWRGRAVELRLQIEALGAKEAGYLTRAQPGSPVCSFHRAGVPSAHQI